MTVAPSIFTLGGRVQLLWTAFDMPVTGLPLEVALGWQKFYFWSFQKNNHASDSQVNVHDYFFETPKNQICAILMQLLMYHCKHRIESCPKQLNPST